MQARPNPTKNKCKLPDLIGDYLSWPNTVACYCAVLRKHKSKHGKFMEYKPLLFVLQRRGGNISQSGPNALGTQLQLHETSLAQTHSLAWGTLQLLCQGQISFLRFFLVKFPKRIWGGESIKYKNCVCLVRNATSHARFSWQWQREHVEFDHKGQIIRGL